MLFGVVAIAFFIQVAFAVNVGFGVAALSVYLLYGLNDSV